MACVSSLSVGAFVLRAGQIRYFINSFKKKPREKKSEEISKDIVAAIVLDYMYIEIIFTIKVNKQTS